MKTGVRDGPWWAVSPGPARIALLLGPEMLFNGVVALRNALYDAGVLRARRLPCAVISIGNLTVGGTGKTPVTSYLAGALFEAGYRVGVVSRGYGRRGGGAPLLVSDGRAILADPAEAGDEPFLIARENPAVPVAVGADRVRSALLLHEAAPREVILLDDAFQHRRIARDLDLLLVDGGEPWGNGRMLPLGPLREPPSSLLRADALVITRSEGRVPPGVGAILARHHPRAAVFHARMESRGFVRTDGEVVAPTALKGLNAYALSGIARPRRFETDLSALGVRVAAARHFPDHHRFRTRDLEEAVAAARSVSAEVLVTTEKDLVRIAAAFPPGAPPLYALAQRLLPAGSPGLLGFVLDRLAALRGGALRAS
jgi:tetraacyldisaccharide 4'-kinase